MTIETNALLLKTSGEVEQLVGLIVTGKELCKRIGCDLFNVVRLQPDQVAHLEARFGLKLYHKRTGGFGEPIHVCMVCDDTGMLDEKPINALPSALYAELGGITPIHGDVLICEVD